MNNILNVDASKLIRLSYLIKMFNKYAIYFKNGKKIILNKYLKKNSN